jgi:hypothetical protein
MHRLRETPRRHEDSASDRQIARPLRMGAVPSRHPRAHPGVRRDGGAVLATAGNAVCRARRPARRAAPGGACLGLGQYSPPVQVVPRLEKPPIAHNEVRLEIQDYTEDSLNPNAASIEQSINVWFRDFMGNCD